MAQKVEIWVEEMGPLLSRQATIQRSRLSRWPWVMPPVAAKVWPLMVAEVIRAEAFAQGVVVVQAAALFLVPAGHTVHGVQAAAPAIERQAREEPKTPDRKSVV